MDGGPGDSAERAGVLKPLVFSLNATDTSELSCVESADDHMIECLVCPNQFNDAKDFCQHLVLEHKIIIADSKMIAYYKGYASYWKKKFEEVPYTKICSKIVINDKKSEENGSEDANEYFYLLSNSITEDKILREKLKRNRLEVVLNQLEKERTSLKFKRACLFCKKIFTGNRDFQCLLCEKKFPDRTTLKEHMRKKQHRQLNPQNKDFDKFYVINYLELGKNWEMVQAEDDTEIQDGDEAVEECWGDWHDKEMDSVCLFCERRFSDNETIIRHLKDIHSFDLCAIKKTRRLSFYQQIKLINYIRRQMFKLCCFSCLRRFESRDELVEHLTVDKHTAFIPDPSMWDEPQYLFPTYENDNLLCALDDHYEDSERSDGGAAVVDANISGDQSGGGLVTSEEFEIPVDSVLWNEDIRLELF